MVKELDPIREKAEQLKKNEDYVKDVLMDGAKLCREMAQNTMEEVRTSLGLYRPKIL